MIWKLIPGMTTVDDIHEEMSVCLARPRDHIDDIKNLTESKQ